jgi:hypothetical protein
MRYMQPHIPTLHESEGSPVMQLQNRLQAYRQSAQHLLAPLPATNATPCTIDIARKTTR